jgi:hypothetical protein
LYGEWEPLANIFDAKHLDRALDFWGSRAFLAERKKPPTAHIDVDEALSSPYAPHRKINCILGFEEELEDKIKFFNSAKTFIYEISNSFCADLSVAHLSSSAEAVCGATAELKFYNEQPERAAAAGHIVRKLDKVIQEQVPFTSQLKLIRTNTLKKFIPNLFWLTVFGPPYVELFGDKHLLNTPAHEIQVLPYGGIGVQLAEYIEDNEIAWKDFLVKRKIAKHHLNSNAFYDPSLPKTHQYSAPDFRIPKDRNGSPGRAVAAATTEVLAQLFDKRKKDR